MHCCHVIAVLLKSYLEQREEMMELKTEVENLERELNNVTLQFEQALEKYNNCNNGVFNEKKEDFILN